MKVSYNLVKKFFSAAKRRLAKTFRFGSKKVLIYGGRGKRAKDASKKPTESNK